MSRNFESGPIGLENSEVFEIGSSQEVKKELDDEIAQLKAQLVGLQNSPFKEKDIKEKIAFLEEQRSLISLNENAEDKKAA